MGRFFEKIFGGLDETAEALFASNSRRAAGRKSDLVHDPIKSS